MGALLPPPPPGVLPTRHPDNIRPEGLPWTTTAIILFISAVFVAAVWGQPAEIPDYDRSEWAHWSDADGDGMSTRHEVLQDESLIPVATNRNASRVLSGRWVDAYTGHVYTVAERLDVDHVVPLREAHVSGGWAWDAEKKEAYANDLSDPSHLMAVSASANRSKGARDPAEWLPSVNVCAYLVDWIRVKTRWDLSYDDAEAQAIVRELAACLN